MKTLAKKNITDVLAHWAEKYDILCPTQTAQGECIFDSFDRATFTLDYTKPPLSPKSIFFPQADIIFKVENNEYREVVSARNTLLFGIRSCDLMGIRQATSFMTRDQQDVYYQAKRDGVLTIGMACPKAQNETCFCTTTHSGPVAEKGFDLQLFDMGEDFLVQVGSARGEALLNGVACGDVDDTSAKKSIAEFDQKAARSIPEVTSVAEAMNKLRDRHVDDKLWNEFGDKCITCGGCAFVCPTCTCFNVYDQQTKTGNGLRVRAWDACLYGGFTREASGHNPRGKQAIRLKRRHEHKLLDYNKTDIQEALCGCVGCGRCSDYCPVHIGTLEVVKAIAG